MTGHIAREYPERSTALLRGFGGTLDRATTAGMAGAAVVAFVISLATRSVGPLNLVLGAVAGAVAGLALARLMVPTGLMDAFEAFSWMGRGEIERFKARTGGNVPLRPPDQHRWLDTHPPTAGNQLPRIEVLAFIGRLDEAQAELGDVSATEPFTAYERASLVQYVGWLSDGDARLDELRASLEGLPLDERGRREAEVTLAIAEARQRFMAGEADWWRPLQAVRPVLGRAATRVVVRDTWGQLALLYSVIGLLVGVVAYLLLPTPPA